mmetsp:Transcript_37341/g.93802  ORF Transcript_37341/g.93802 Transcript_37341/m.93802 type:complete len:210 (+) Transcript_37341:3-632(+)
MPHGARQLAVPALSRLPSPLRQGPLVAPFLPTKWADSPKALPHDMCSLPWVLPLCQRLAAAVQYGRWVSAKGGPLHCLFVGSTLQLPLWSVLHCLPPPQWQELWRQWCGQASSSSPVSPPAGMPPELVLPALPPAAPCHCRLQQPRHRRTSQHSRSTFPNSRRREHLRGMQELAVGHRKSRSFAAERAGSLLHQAHCVSRLLPWMCSSG